MSRPVLLLVCAAIVIGATAAGYLLARQHSTGGARLPPMTAASPPVSAVMTGERRPDFSLPDLNGVVRDVGEWDGQVLVVNFWATWCPPCRKEIPEFVELQEKYRTSGLQFVGIALQRPEEVRDFVEEYRVNYPVLAGEMAVVRISEAYGNQLGALPYTVIIDRSGRIRFNRPGPLPGREAEQLITALL